MASFSEFTTDHPMVGKWVEYSGDNRLSDLGGIMGKVASVKVYTNGSATYAVKYAGSDKLQYAADWAWEIVEPEPGPYNGPHGKALEAIDSELIALGKRQLELKAARKVLESL